jgi:hypothetical protein
MGLPSIIVLAEKDDRIKRQRVAKYLRIKAKHGYTCLGIVLVSSN